MRITRSSAAAYADLVRLYNDRDVLAQTLAVREKSLALSNIGASSPAGPVRHRLSAARTQIGFAMALLQWAE